MSAPILVRARQLAAEALRSGALEPLRASVHRVEGFEVRLLSGFDRKPSGRGKRPDPFLPPYPPALHVADWPPAHAILLNRFPVLDDHLLIVTLAALSQEEPASAEDLEVLERLLDQIDGLGFYNGGRDAGASQPHRHLQLVSREALGPLPLEPAILDALAAGAARVPGWPFAHAIGGPSVPTEALFSSLGLDSASPGSHSLLLTRSWRLLAPRRSGQVRGMPVNSLGYAGLLAVKSAEQLDALRQMGPLALLAEAGRPW